MSSMIIDCLSKAIFMFIAYNAIVLLLFGVPPSLSMTHYLFKEKQNMLKVLFPAFITMLCMFLIPCWLQISHGATFQFTAFLSAGMLLFVGASPYFNNSKLENLVHNISAYCCAGFAILWIVLVTQLWWVILIVLSLITIAAILTKTWKNCYIYWLEIGVFLSTFSSIILYYITNK
jgi:hypothetical protein